MDSSVVVNRASLRIVLKSWHHVIELGKSELVGLDIVRDKIGDRSTTTPAALGLTLRSELEVALDELKQTYRLASGEENTFHTLLTEHFVARRGADFVKDLLSVERSEFYRRLIAAMDALASILNAKELRLRTSKTKSGDITLMPGETKPIFQAPRPMTDQLIGRDHFLHVLKERLTSGRTTVLFGIPGVGKTSSAISLANDPEVLSRFTGGVLWANLGIAPDPLSSLKRWGHALGVPTDVINTAAQTVLAQNIHDRIGLRSFVIIIDDAWDVNAAMLLQVGGSNCHHVITTRLLDVAIVLADTAGPLRVEELTLSESITLLSTYVDERALSAFDISLESLAKASSGLPLSLMLTGRLLSQAMHSGMKTRFRKLLLALQDPAQRMRLSIPVGPNDIGGSAGAQLSVFTQIAATEEVLSSEAKQALTDLSVLQAKPHSFSAEAALMVCDCTIDTIDELVAYGLLETMPGDRFTLHQSISEYAQLRMNDAQAWLRMTRWYADYAESHETNYVALDAEWDNMQYAFMIAQQQNCKPELLRASHALHSFLLSRNMSERAYGLLTETLTWCRQTKSPATVARHLVLFARTAIHERAYEEATGAIQEALQLIYKNREATQLLPTACEIAAMVADAVGKTDEAMQWYERAMEAAQTTRQIHLIPRMLVNMELLPWHHPRHGRKLSVPQKPGFAFNQNCSQAAR